MTNNIARLQTAVRCLSILVAFELMMDFVSPALWVLTEYASVISTVSRLASSSTALAAAWLLSAALVVPFVLMQIVWPDCRHRTSIIKTATYGLILGTLIWVFMAFLSRNLDYRFVFWIFLLNGLGSLGMAALMANSINNDQKEAEQQQQGGV